MIQDRLRYVIVTHNPSFLSFKTGKISFSFTQNVLAGLAGAGLDLFSARDVASPSGTGQPQLRETSVGNRTLALNVGCQKEHASPVTFYRPSTWLTSRVSGSTILPCGW